ncbi:hypothetical protein DDB_G0276167 [Dictyostelium discoideum AX4]|uniref:Uncharacterized protein n=1 Tax=Dictyostelium discoideum TaxID=44689 RepID=Q551Y3_DICDI|nr:hypothetical protein DDB_G0276167 [Dictyostelium discoideum AX4]EAL69383.1 hypothetical protein DDB_G0276167 [Dictyostelium discoideum AX4]|eukprot:XP_643345.1 hypothetical protein DDB_G0276167 [Dictyostelium discoideum AX4]
MISRSLISFANKSLRCSNSNSIIKCSNNIIVNQTIIKNNYSTSSNNNNNNNNNNNKNLNPLKNTEEFKGQTLKQKEEYNELTEAYKFRMVERPDLLTISSFFRYPEGGVEDYTNLSKGTAFLARAPSGLLSKPNNSLYCISCAHITHPFHFPNLYKEDQYSWIYSLGEKNIKVQLEYRDQKTGKLLNIIPLKPPFHLHPMLDLVVFKVDEDDFNKTNLPYHTTIMELEHYEFPKEGHEGKLYGYQLISESENIMKPIETPYVFHFDESPERFYVSTRNPSPMGICGGPVINIENEVIGMIEGLAKIDQSTISKTTDPEKKQFFNKINSNTVFIPSQELNRFLSKIDMSYDSNGNNINSIDVEGFFNKL